MPGAAPLPAAVADALERAWADRPEGYTPRTRHVTPEGAPRFTNRLLLETSPYLRQHAHNPVNWHPWGEEALAAARALGRPIFLSVGYSTCHWCHVMEEESFEDEAIAARLNERFIAIKVDREERPDIDGVFMQAVQLMTRRGGWPMTVVLTPDGEPYFGATYIPPRAGARGARKGLYELLDELATSYAEDPERARQRGQQIADALRRANAPAPPGDAPGVEALDAFLARQRERYDAAHGGFGPAPKFPPSDALGLLLRLHRRRPDPQALEMVTRTLEAMAAGGVHDQLGGGFHRYSTDARWLVPHFEKMLYDNALLAVAYLEGYQVTGRREFADIAARTLDYVAREMTAPGGGFYSATDADSPTPEGAREEGYFFTWTPAELEAALGPELAELVATTYGVSPSGNFEGRSILYLPRPLAETAARLELTPEALAERLAGAHETLYARRAERPPPLRDDKILTAWNGLMIAAFARGAVVLGRDDYRERAARAASFLEDHVLDEAGRPRRSFKDGRASGAAVLDDHAFLIHGLLELHEATGDARWLRRALALQRLQDERFRDPDGGAYFMTAHDAESLLARELPDHDGAMPSGNSLALHNLLRLALLTGDAAVQTHADALLAAFATPLRERAGGLAVMLAGLERALDRPREVFLLIPEGEGEARARPLLDVARGAYLPNRALLVLREGPQLDENLSLVPALEGKRALGGEPTAYVCERGRCELPTSDPAVLRRQLADAPPLPPAATDG
ncbi:MAG: thioredoxin domain-containing protein [Myxococcales bacterium]|nr:thioredoxin domain-containing protein [Myxococcales bacterium]